MGGEEGREEGEGEAREVERLPKLQLYHAEQLRAVVSSSIFDRESRQKAGIQLRGAEVQCHREGREVYLWKGKACHFWKQLYGKGNP